MGDIAERASRGERERGRNVEADGRGKDDDGGARFGKEARVRRSLVTSRHDDEDDEEDEDDNEDDGGDEDNGDEGGKRERRVHDNDNEHERDK